MVIGIGQFRNIANTSSQDAGRFHIQDDQIVRSKRGFFGKIISHIKGVSASNVGKNREAASAFKNAIKAEYGDAIGDAISNNLLPNQIGRGKPLSAYKITTVLNTAEALKKHFMARNEQRAQSVADTGLTNFFHEITNREPKPDELKTFKDQALRALRLDPSFKQNEMNDAALVGILQTTVEHYCAQKNTEFAQRHPGLQRRMEQTPLNSVETFLQTLPEAEQGFAHQLLAGIQVGHNLLSVTPISPEGIAEWEEQRQAITTGLDAARADAFVNISSVRDRVALQDEIDHLTTVLQQKAEHLTELSEKNPLSEQNVTYARALMAQAARDVLTVEMQALMEAGMHDQYAVLLGLSADLQAESAIEQQQASHEPAENAAGRLKQYPNELHDRLQQTFETAGLSSRGLAGRLHKAHVNVLNQAQAWDTVTKNVQFSQNGVVHDYNSTITPASQLGNIFAQRYTTTTVNDNEELVQQPASGGISSHSFTETEHAVNLAHTQIQDNNGEVLFQGLRHGIHCAFGIDDRTQRTQANQNRAAETVLAAVVTDNTLLNDALAGQTVEPRILSISLVTPDDLRALNPSSNTSNEKLQMREQQQAWASLSGQTQSMTVLNDEDQTVEINVKPDIAMVNFGVNEGAVEMRQGPKSLLRGAMGWDNAKPINDHGLGWLLGDLTPMNSIGGQVGQFLARDDVSATDKGIVRELTQQIRGMYADGSYRHGDNDPYKMVARLALLADKVGVTVAFNCKSGKDRTGMLDAEIKHLASQIQLSGQVPKPETAMNDQDTAMYREFVFNTGNLEMQRLNTGLAGFKTENVPGIDYRIGDEQARDYHRGGSHYVKE